MCTEVVHFVDEVTNVEVFSILQQVGVLEADRLGDIFWLLSAGILPVVAMCLRCQPVIEVAILLSALKVLPRVLGFLSEPLFHQMVVEKGQAVLKGIM
jgi:hypothetical protein